MAEFEKQQLQYYKSEAKQYLSKMNIRRAGRLKDILFESNLSTDGKDIRQYLDDDYHPEFIKFLNGCPQAMHDILFSIGFRLRMLALDGIDDRDFENLDFPPQGTPLEKKSLELVGAGASDDRVEADISRMKDDVAIIRAEAIALAQLQKEKIIPFVTREFYLALAAEYQKVGLEIPSEMEFLLGASDREKLTIRKQSMDSLAADIKSALTGVMAKDKTSGGVHPKVARRGAQAEVDRMAEEAVPQVTARKENIKKELAEILKQFDKFVGWLLDLPTKEKWLTPNDFDPKQRLALVKD